MRAIVFEQPQRIAFAQIPEPELPSEGEALVRVHRVGVCGTDISGYLGKMPFFTYPRIPGHELGVEVVAVGNGVTNVKPSDRCSVEPYLNDPTSFASRAGRPNCCERLKVLGVHIDGGLRSHFLLPARKLHPSKSLAWEQLALVETLGIGCHCVNRAAPQAAENVLVIGAGPIGLAVIEFLRLAGVRILVLDMNRRRLEFCEQTMQVDHTLLLPGDGSEIQTLRDLTDGRLPTLVIDATGSVKSMSQAVQYVAPTGRVVYVGITPEAISVPDPLLHSRELTIMGTRNALPEDFTRIIRLIEGGKIDTRPWITHRTSFEALVEVFPSFTQPETGVIKAMVELS